MVRDFKFPLLTVRDPCLFPPDEEEHELLSLVKEQLITAEEKRDHMSPLEETLEEGASLDKLLPFSLLSELPDSNGEYRGEPVSESFSSTFLGSVVLQIIIVPPPFHHRGTTNMSACWYRE